jgi:peptidoglycan hydrolase-like protein with peptidoglycan-binding domain
MRRPRAVLSALTMGLAAGIALSPAPAGAAATRPVAAGPVAAGPVAGTPVAGAAGGRVLLAAASAPAPILRAGARGPEVLAVQQRLQRLGYWLGSPDGDFGPLTVQAVYAYQKVARLGVDGQVGPATRATLAKDLRPKARSTSGRVVEIDLARQLTVRVTNGRVTEVYNSSAGGGYTYRGSDGRDHTATTPTGRFRINRQIDGWRTSYLGELWRPKYFTSTGIALHGAPSVPARAVSHGCNRVSIAAMDHIWSSGTAPVGTAVWVYR